MDIADTALPTAPHVRRSKSVSAEPPAFRSGATPPQNPPPGAASRRMPGAAGWARAPAEPARGPDSTHGTCRTPLAQDGSSVLYRVYIHHLTRIPRVPPERLPGNNP